MSASTSATKQQLGDYRLDVVAKGNDLSGLPPTTIVSATIDPLRSEAITLTAMLRDGGVPVAHETYPGVTHEFFGMGQVIAQAKLAEDFATSRLRQAFGQ